MQLHSIQSRFDLINQRIQEACRRSGRAREEVKLVAVSKTHPPDKVREAAEAGIRVFGESKVQEARAKIPMCPSHLSWHLVGHLQTNKVRHAVRLFDMIHAIDSLRLLKTVGQACETAGRELSVCIEVNVSGERSKYGIKEEELPSLLEASIHYPRIEVVGLMTLPPWSEDQEKARPYFRKLWELRERCREEWKFSLEELSMGMSHDFEVAIEEGATWIRVGAALLGSRKAAR